MNNYMPVDTTAQYNVQNIENALPDEYIKISIEKGSSENERIFTVEECA